MASQCFIGFQCLSNLGNWYVFVYCVGECFISRGKADAGYALPGKIASIKSNRCESRWGPHIRSGPS